MGWQPTPAYPTVAANDVAWISEQDMVKIDRAMVDDVRIELIQMMETAGRNLARLVLDLASPDRATSSTGGAPKGRSAEFIAQIMAARSVAGGDRNSVDRNRGLAVSRSTTRAGST